MWFRSMMVAGNLARAVILLAAIPGVLATSGLAPAAARGSEPNRFAGHYVPTPDGDCRISISETGRVHDSSKWFRGSVSADGFMELSWPVFSFDRSRGSGPSRMSAAGIAELDQNGNLYALLLTDDGVIFEIFWPRCP